MNMDSKRRLSYAKTLWKKRIQRLSNKLETLVRRERGGATLSMGELWNLAHDFVAAGGHAAPLIAIATKLDMLDRVKEDILFNAQLVEAHCDALAELAKRMGYPTRTMPRFESELFEVAPLSSPDDAHVPSLEDALGLK